MTANIDDPRIHKVLDPEGDDTVWRGDFERLLGGDVKLTRASAGEGSIKAFQRLLIFLGYSTSSGGSFSIDGDFGRGTNRGVAQFQFEHGLNPKITRDVLCYPCSFQTARREIVAIPDARVDVPTLSAMLQAAVDAIDGNEVTFGDLDDALFHLNAVHRRQLLSCREIFGRYRAAVDAAVETMKEEQGVAIEREWVLAIIKQETSGICRPRFEQHKLSSANAKRPDADLVDLRYESESIGLGQVMGFNFRKVGAPSARAMLLDPVEKQVLYVARFIAPKKEVVSKAKPAEEDFRTLARYYNGPAYESHHYHESLETWFREFKLLSRGG